MKQLVTNLEEKMDDSLGQIVGSQQLFLDHIVNKIEVLLTERLNKTKGQARGVRSPAELNVSIIFISKVVFGNVCYL